MKTTVIYHSADYDGLFCREIARKFLPDAELIGWDYGDETMPVPEGRIYILDLSPDCMFTKGAEPDQEVWTGLFNRIVWIDHHKSAIEKWGSTGSHDRIPGYRIDGVAACRLAWFYFTAWERFLTQTTQPDLVWFHDNYPWATKSDFIDRKLLEPLAVRLAGEYDIWDKRDPRAELFQHGLRSRALNDTIWELLLVPFQEPDQDGKKDAGTIMVEALLEAGEALQYARTRENESVIKANGFTIEWEGLKFLACNHARFNSHLFTAGLKPEHDACFGFKWTGKDWSVSLYHAPGKEHHDLSLIAVKHGGGGHRGACGFRAKNISFLT